MQKDYQIVITTNGTYALSFVHEEGQTILQ